MVQPTKQDFSHIKDQLKDGRLSPDSIRFYLGVFLIFSGILIGVAYMGANASNTVIGWENLSYFWQSIFKLEVLVFILQLVLIFFIRGKSNASQMVLTISYLFYTYKLALDPFVTMSIFAMNDGVYETFAPIFLIVIITGFLFHLYYIIRSFKKVNQQKNRRNKSLSVPYVFPIIFVLASITGYVVKNKLLGEYEMIFGLSIFTLFYFGVMIGAVEFIKGIYCLIRFPSFRVNQ